MSLRLLVRKLELEGRRVTTAGALRDYCKAAGTGYYPAVGYLITRRYIARILRGVFYVRSVEERKLGRTDIYYADAIAEALRLKGIANWYFGLETAAKLNNLTYERSEVTYVLSDTLFRGAPIGVLGHKVKFIKIKKHLFGFGTKKHVSDAEKTVLDMIYLSRYNGFEEDRLRGRVADLLPSCDEKRLCRYSRHYPKTVREELGRMLEWTKKR